MRRRVAVALVLGIVLVLALEAAPLFVMFQGGPEGAVVVTNEMDEPVAYQITMVRESDGETVLDTEGVIEPENKTRFDLDPPDTETQYTVRIQTNRTSEPVESRFDTGGGFAARWLVIEDGGEIRTETIIE